MFGIKKTVAHSSFGRSSRCQLLIKLTLTVFVSWPIEDRRLLSTNAYVSLTMGLKIPLIISPLLLQYKLISEFLLLLLSSFSFHAGTSFLPTIKTYISLSEFFTISKTSLQSKMIMRFTPKYNISYTWLFPTDMLNSFIFLIVG